MSARQIIRVKYGRIDQDATVVGFGSSYDGEIASALGVVGRKAS